MYIKSNISNDNIKWSESFVEFKNFTLLKIEQYKEYVMINYQNDLPLGLSMALSKNVEAMNRFTSLSQTQQQNFINRTHSVRSKKEMEKLVNELTANTQEFF